MRVFLGVMVALALVLAALGLLVPTAHTMWVLASGVVDALTLPQGA